MLSRIALILVAALACAAFAAPADEPIQWRSSRSLGVPWDGTLVRGVQLPAEGEHFFTWDPVKKRSPGRPWRRWGSDRLLRIVLGFSTSTRLRIRRRAGWASATSRGRTEASSTSASADAVMRRTRTGATWTSTTRGSTGRSSGRSDPAQVDRVLSQELVNRFVRAGAVKVFVGPHVGLRGPRRKVQRLIYHDDHMHVRIGADPQRSIRIGRSARGRPIRAFRAGDTTTPNASARRRLHPRERVRGDRGHAHPRPFLALGRPLGRVEPQPGRLRARPPPNGRGVDLNRNFPSEWRPAAGRGNRSARAPSHSRSPRRALAARLIRRDRAFGHHLVPPGRRRSCAPGARASPPRDGTRAWPDEVPRHPLAARNGARTGRTTASPARARSWSSCPQARSPRRLPTDGPSGAHAPRFEHFRVLTVLAPGDRVPDATVWLAPREQVTACRARRGPIRPLHLPALRLVVDLNGRDGAPA